MILGLRSVVGPVYDYDSSGLELRTYALLSKLLSTHVNVPICSGDNVRAANGRKQNLRRNGRSGTAHGVRR